LSATTSTSSAVQIGIRPTFHPCIAWTPHPSHGALIVSSPPPLHLHHSTPRHKSLPPSLSRPSTDAAVHKSASSAVPLSLSPLATTSEMRRIPSAGLRLWQYQTLSLFPFCLPPSLPPSHPLTLSPSHPLTLPPFFPSPSLNSLPPPSRCLHHQDRGCNRRIAS
jgi:hypothetical protein